MKWVASFPEELDGLSVMQIIEHYSQKTEAKVFAVFSLRAHAQLILRYDGFWGPIPQDNRARRIKLSEKLLASAVQIERSLPVS